MPPSSTPSSSITLPAYDSASQTPPSYTTEPPTRRTNIKFPTMGQRCRYWILTLLAISALLLGVSSVYGGVVIIKHSESESGKMLGGVLCCIIGVIVGIGGIASFLGIQCCILPDVIDG